MAQLAEPLFTRGYWLETRYPEEILHATLWEKTFDPDAWHLEEVWRFWNNDDWHTTLMTDVLMADKYLLKL